jgi:hypothetical protein
MLSENRRYGPRGVASELVTSSQEFGFEQQNLTPCTARNRPCARCFAAQKQDTVAISDNRSRDGLTRAACSRDPRGILAFRNF